MVPVGFSKGSVMAAPPHSTIRPSSMRTIRWGQLGDLRVVGDHHQGLGKGPDGALEQGQHVGAGPAVQVAGGLVGQDQGGLGHQGPGDGHPLLLPAGELVGHAGELLLQPQHPHHLLEEGGVGVSPSSSTGRTMFS